ncbi:unnamed protein product [Cuscuta epithymum]|uniref:C3H1-type domain-containing protein n=1 Tax=Cuscuta epithymum TaxID=186058 RepID=A0AAV0EWM0_9ASTE|nr:unnamed protein product [Cuscuta epithymum]CAH9127674.1 unnamed protein product [Cuscuta epithymum]
MFTKKRNASTNVNGNFKKTKQELETNSSGIGSKSKPCTKFFSTAGCPFGESCHFLHYVPGGYNAVAQIMNLAPAPAPRNVPPPPAANGAGSGASVKNKLCNKYNTAEGCKFGDKCRFAHGEWEIGKSLTPAHEDHYLAGPPSIPGRYGGRVEPVPMSGPAASFGLSATAKISVDASLAGAIIGKSGVNSKHICRQTGVKLSIRDHETDTNLKNIEIEGSFDKIALASEMVKDLIGRLGSMGRAVAPSAHGGGGGPANSGNHFKTKLCDNFSKGVCTFAEKCHFAHGAAELRKSGTV